MNKKIFHSNFMTSLLVLLLSFVLVFGVLFNYFEERIFNELESEASYIAHAVKNEGLDYINNFNDYDRRITLVSQNGTVLADTSKNASELDNHANRKEILDAQKNGIGQSSRYSDTLMQKTLYYATKLDDGNILRVSTTQHSVITIFIGLIQPLLLIIILALILSFIISQKISASIMKPINTLNLDEPMKNDVYEELTPLLKKLSLQKQLIEKQIKDALQKQEEFKLITENMNEGFLIIDNYANVLSYNHAAVNLLEIGEMTDVLGFSILKLNRTSVFKNSIETALNGKKSESIINHDDRTYNMLTNPVYDDNKIIGAVIIIIDITESAKREQLRREFTSNVSHELKTPLTSISGFAEIMKSGDIPKDTIIDFSNSIYEEAQRLISLVSDIMKISELDEGKIIYEKNPIDLYELSKNIIEKLKPTAEKHNISMNLIGQSSFVYGTKKILEELLYNLCDNAIKYNKQNGSVDIIINIIDNKIDLMVRDTGIGIPCKDQSRIFERFYRVDKSHSKLIGGTGLGLAIVKHSALYHNAKIKLESVENKGTTITVTFEKYEF